MQLLIAFLMAFMPPLSAGLLIRYLKKRDKARDEEKKQEEAERQKHIARTNSIIIQLKCMDAGILAALNGQGKVYTNAYNEEETRLLLKLQMSKSEIEL